jgi:aminopeptidase N
MRSLTVSEARTRAASIRVESYDIVLDMTRGDRYFASSTTIEFQSVDRQPTWVDVQCVELLAAHLNGRRLDVGADGVGVSSGRLRLDGLEARNSLVIEAVMAYSRDGEGLHRAVDPEDKEAYVYAMTFLSAAPRVFACFDQPDLKARFRMGARVPQGWRVVGNGRATELAPGLWTLAETKPISTYLATIVAGPYHSVVREHDGITLGFHCRQSLAPHLDKDADELFAVTAEAFDEYHRLFGIRYPFGDYHQVFCAEFNAGAMENPGCVTHSDVFVFKARPTDTLRATRAEIVSHEMAHQWFGDLVTMRWWDDLWLNESFADYMGYRVTADVTAFTDVWTEFAYIRKPWGMAADQRRSTHPVAGNGARDTEAALSDFDGISYCKGAAALRQLNAYLGDEAFLAGVIDHLDAHSYGNARLDDLLGAWDRASDRDVRAWADAWLRTSGVDTLTLVMADDGQPVVERVNGSPQDVARQHAITVSWYADDGRAEHVPITVAGDRTPVPFAAYDGTGFVLPDSRDDTWAKIVLDDRSLAEASRILATLDDPLARAVIWGALRESMLDSLLDPQRYLEILEAALPRESDIAIEAILRDDMRHGTSSLNVYLTARSDRRARVAGLAAAILADSAPGSNRQLLLARAVVNTTDDPDLLRAWLDGGAPAGVVADEDLRWRLTRALCAMGVFGADEIGAERQRDPSSQGSLAALACSSAIPDPEIKDGLWTTLMTDESLSNYELFALADSFFQPAQMDALSPYVTRYFAELPAMPKGRTGFMAERFTDSLFPRYSVTQDTVDLAEQLIADDSVSHQIRRAVADSADDLVRAVASREAFGW